MQLSRYTKIGLALFVIGLVTTVQSSSVRAAILSAVYTYTDNYVYTVNGVEVYGAMDDGGAGGNLGATMVKGGTGTYSVTLTNMSQDTTPTNVRVRLPAGYQYVTQVSGATQPTQPVAGVLQWPAYPVPPGESKIVIQIRAQ
ncbi:MAG: hypothetical protein WC045_04190 [Patescibacteria group bacterium]